VGGISQERFQRYSPPLQARCLLRGAAYRDPPWSPPGAALGFDAGLETPWTVAALLCNSLRSSGPDRKPP